MKGLTDQDRIARIKQYRSWIDDWKYTLAHGGPESLRDDIHDLEAHINAMNGPSDGDRGIRRAKRRAGQTRNESDPNLVSTI